METVCVKDLKTPDSAGLTETDLQVYKSGEASRRWSKSPLPIDHDLNARVFLYDGDIELLSAEAIVNPTNESLTELAYVLKVGGQSLIEHVRRRTVHCATGDVCITPSFSPNYKHIIHAVPPKYQPKYRSAAETALFHTYFRVLEVMIERKIRTVVMPILSTVKCNFPIEDNCELQLRIIRRILEKKRDKFDKIVLHVRDIESHAGAFYTYFPRTPLDEEAACYRLPSSLGGPNGEPVIPGREIRIKGKPAAWSSSRENSIDLTSGLDLSTVVGKTDFSKMRDDVETKTGRFGDSPRPGPSNQVVALRRKSVLRGCNLF